MRKIEIEELKRLELDLLDFFVGVCKHNNLTYFLAGGTLLGAIRHQGFIPWDDDIDVMMPRQDYEKMKKVFPVHEYYKFMCHDNTHNYPTAFGTLNDIRTFKPETSRREKCRMLSVNIDIFPIDSLPDEEECIHKYFRDISNMARKLFCITYSYGIGKTISLTVKRNIGIFVYRCLELFGVTSIDRITEEYSALSQKYAGRDTKKCAVTCSYIYGEGEVNLKADYYPVQAGIFERKEYNIPANYDAYLKGLYGNYMQLPPIEKQVPHHANCYWKDSILKQNT